MSKNKQEYIEKLEKAIQEKYGDGVVQEIGQDWTEQKEKQYIEESERLNKKKAIKSNKDVDIGGFFVNSKLLNKRKKAINVCERCGKTTIYKEDDLYIIKFLMCKECYLCYVEFRKKENSDEKK